MAGLTTSLIIGGAVLGAGAIGANAQARAGERAADAQGAASAEATRLQRDIYNDQRGLLAPQIEAGAGARARQMLMQGMSPEEVRSYLQGTNNAIGGPGGGGGSAQATDEQLQQRYGSLYAHWQGGDRAGGVRYDNFRDYLGSGNYDLTAPRGADGSAPQTGDPGQFDWVDNWNYQANSPSYQFRMDEGQRGLERSAAARGRLFSGATGMALQRYGQDYASQEFENDFRRFGALSGAGDQAAGGVVNAAGSFGQQAGQNINNAGAARASGYLAGGNAWGNFWGNTVPGGIGFGMGNWGGK